MNTPAKAFPTMLLIDIEKLDPQVIGLTMASRPTTLRMMTPAQQIEARIRWMRQAFGGSSA